MIKQMKKVRVFKTASQRQERLPTNSIRLLKIGDLRICLVNDKDNLYAVSDECTHDRASLSQGFVNNQKEIICPLHNYRFSLINGRCSRENCRPLETYALNIENDETFIEIPES